MFCYQKNFFNPTLPVDEAQFFALVRATQWNETIDKFRETGDQKLKRGLPAFIFQATFDETQSKKGMVGRWRKQAATQLTGLVVMDVDHVDDPREVHGSWLKAHDLKALGVLLVYITPSGKGLKIVFKADAEKGNLIDNQHAMAKVLGVEVDESCKDASRMSFICKESDILYLDKELFTYENKEFSERYTALYRDGRSQATATDCHKTTTNSTKTTFNESELASIEWRGYDIQSFINARYADKLPCAKDSNRHNESLKLATDLLIMLDGDKQQVERILRAQPWVEEIVNERDENVGQTVSSAADCVANKEKKTANPYPSAAMQTAIEKATGHKYSELVAMKSATETADGAANAQMSLLRQQLKAWGAQIRQMQDEFPCLREIGLRLEDEALPAALFCSSAMMGTLMTRTWYHFYHRPNEERRLNYCVYVIGHPGSGKSFVGELYDVLLQPIRDSDQLGYDALNRYKREKNERETSSKEQKKDAIKKPDVIIRIHPSRTANGVFIEDMIKAVEQVGQREMHLHLFTFDAELDNNTRLGGSGSGTWIDKQVMELKAFHNEEDGQAYANRESVMGMFNVFWNYVYTGTLFSLKRKTREVQGVASGLTTRLAVLPMPSTNFKMMDMDKRTQQDNGTKVLSEWAYRLDKVSGELPLWPMVKECWEWTRDHMMLADINQDKADELLIKRVAYYGIAVSAPFVLMRHWKEWEEKGTFEVDDCDLQLCRLALDIQYHTQHHYFGEYAANYFADLENDKSVERKRHTKTRIAYSKLPDVFGIEDVEREYGVTLSGARVVVSRLKKDKIVKKIKEGDDKGKYQKVTKSI